MRDLTPIIETMEHRWMRAWANRDLKTLKSLTARDFLLLTGSKPAAILDRPSWLEAAGKRYQLNNYRFSDIYVRDHGSIATFAARLDVDSAMDKDEWSGPLWVTDLWKRGKMRRGWKLVQRVVSHVDDDPKVPKAIRALQLWR
jgi:hypothetical protein